jgi:hypothetical protein
MSRLSARSCCVDFQMAFFSQMPVRGKAIVRKVTLFGGCGNPLAAYSRQNDPLQILQKSPPPSAAGFRGIGQGKFSTKGRPTSLRFSEVIDGLELVQFFLRLITDRLEMIDDGECCPGFHA